MKYLVSNNTQSVAESCLEDSVSLVEVNGAEWSLMGVGGAEWNWVAKGAWFNVGDLMFSADEE